LSPREQESNPNSRSSMLGRFIAATVAKKLKDKPDVLARMIELEIVDADFLEDFGSVDLETSIRRLGDELQARVIAEPSVLNDLRIRPLDFMRIEMDDQAPVNSISQVEQTIAFSDLEGFTNFTSRNGDVEASALLGDHYEAVDAIVRSRGGQIVKRIGDGHMLAFAEPAAAVMASLEMVESAPGPLRVRVGAHSGTVVVSEQDYFGHVVNVASRVTGVADGGTTLVTSVVRTGAGRLREVTFGLPRMELLEGIDEPVEVSEVRLESSRGSEVTH
jgi:adenylate cyclase